jgi:putative ABC transport system permease protein
MSGYDLLRFASTALRGHRLRTLLSVVGVSIGVASVIVLTSLGEGARLYVTDEFTNLGSNLLFVIPGKTETTGMAPFGSVSHDLPLDDADAVRRRVPRSRHLAPLTMGEARARFGERARDVTVAGTTAELREVRDLRMQAGRYLPGGDPNRAPRVCVLGSEIRRELFADANPLGEILRIGDERYRVIGVIEPRGMSVGMDLDEMIHVPVVRAMRLFDQTTLFRIMVEVGSHEEVETVKGEIIAVLTERHDGEEDVTLLSQDSVLSAFGRILTALTLALGGIAATSLTVAGVGIMNVMLVSVSERTREIGLLKAVGVTPAQVLLAFLVEASILSSLGGLLGFGAGIAAIRVFTYFYPAFPAQPPVWAVVGSLALSVSIGVLFGALPARRASRLDPVQALAGGRA